MEQKEQVEQVEQVKQVKQVSALSQLGLKQEYLSVQLNTLGEVQSLSQVNYSLKYFGKYFNK